MRDDRSASPDDGSISIAPIHDNASKNDALFLVGNGLIHDNWGWTRLDVDVDGQ